MSTSYVRVRSDDAHVIRRHATVDRHVFDLDMFLAKMGSEPTYALAQALYDMPSAPDADVQAAVARQCLTGDRALDVFDRAECIIRDLNMRNDVAVYARQWLLGAMACGGPCDPA